MKQLGQLPTQNMIDLYSDEFDWRPRHSHIHGVSWKLEPHILDHNFRISWSIFIFFSTDENRNEYSTITCMYLHKYTCDLLLK